MRTTVGKSADDEDFAALERAIERAEALIGRMGFAVGADVAVTIDEAMGTTLCVRKTNEGRRLFVVFPVGPQPLTSTSLKIRIAAVDAIPRLIDAMTKATQTRKREVAEAAKLLDAYLDTIEPKVK